MMVFTILAVVVVALYLGCYIYVNKELPASISAMVYDLPKRQQWLWSAWLCLVAALLFEPLVEKAGGVGWLASVCLMGTALMPLINQETRTWHYVLAYASAFLTQAIMVWLNPWWLLTWLLFFAVCTDAFFTKDKKKWYSGKGVTIMECVCFIALAGSLLIN